MIQSTKIKSNFILLIEVDRLNKIAGYPFCYELPHLKRREAEMRRELTELLFFLAMQYYLN